MHHDFFLTNRALQLQRLLDRETGNRISIPDRHARADCSRHLTSLYRSIDRIAKLPVGDQQSSGLLSKLKIGTLLARNKDDSRPQLTNAQRELLIEFERNLVRVHLEDDAHSNRASTPICNALLADHEFFNGLKPIPQYSDDFAYELLFPTWFNLLTVMSQTVEDRDEARFSIDQQRTCMQFLDDWKSKSKESDAPLVAALTLLANRFPPPKSHVLIQRLINLCFDKDGSAVSRHVSWLSRLQETTDSARKLTQQYEDYLVVNSCLTKPGRRQHDLAGTRIVREELPRAVCDTLVRLQDDDHRQASYVLLLNLVGTVINHVDGFDATFETLLNRYPSQLPELLGLVVSSTEQLTARSKVVQGLIAELISQETGEASRVDIERIKPFATHLAPRMDSMSRPAATFFQAEFISRPANRKALISGCRREESRVQLAHQLIKAAKSAKNVERMLNLIAVAASANPSLDLEPLEAVHAAIAVLQMAKRDQSIGRNELGDLVIDIQQGLPETLDSLARPLEAALQKSERLAKLYLTLNEEVQILRHSGKVSNFGVTRASYSHLSRHADGQ